MNNNKLGKRLRQLRKEKYNTDTFTLRAAAKEINEKYGLKITGQYLEQIENGGVKKQNPITCDALAEFYKMPVKDLIKLMVEDKNSTDQID